MPPKDKKWGPSEERDLAMAVILAQQGERVKYDWPKVHEYMTGWGYSFTRDAMSYAVPPLPCNSPTATDHKHHRQHWTKRVMKDFKQRHGQTPSKAAAANAGAASDTPTPSKISCGAKATKAKKIPKEEVDDSGEGELSSPTKKRKRVLKTEDEDDVAVKEESNPRGRERRYVNRLFPEQ